MLESNIPISYLVAASIGFTIVVMATYLVLATMLLDSGVECVKLRGNILGSIVNDSGNLLIRQQLMTIWCQNRYLSSFL